MRFEGASCLAVLMMSLGGANCLWLSENFDFTKISFNRLGAMMPWFQGCEASTTTTPCTPGGGTTVEGIPYLCSPGSLYAERLCRDCDGVDYKLFESGRTTRCIFGADISFACYFELAATGHQAPTCPDGYTLVILSVWFVLLMSVLGVTLAFPDKLGSPERDLGSAVAYTGEDATAKDSSADEELEEEEEEKRPYSFAWKASRHYNGAPDREHIEERNEDGITRGVFRYVDPHQQIQEVVYHSDDTGFHVEASNLPQDTPAVHAARQRHMHLFEKIKKEHEKISKELESKRKHNEETKKD